jgi:hypothetical protein
MLGLEDGCSRRAEPRSRLLSELLQTLDEAQHILAIFPVDADQQVEAQMVFIQIEAARIEIRSLQFNRPLPTDADCAKWQSSTAWG